MALTMSVSVIISTHNRPGLLRLTLFSILKQRLLPDEVIIIDDGSTVSVSHLIADIINDMRHKGIDVKFFRFNNEVGLGAARLFGAYKSSCEYLVFIDDDALAGSSLLEVYINKFKGEACDIIAGLCLPLYPKNVKFPSWWDENVLGSLVAVRNDIVLLSRRVKPQDYVYGCNFAMRRNVLKEVKGFKPWLGRVRGTLLGGEESDLVARAYYRGFKICFEKDAVIYHIITPNKITLKRVINAGISTAKVRALLQYEGSIRRSRSLYLVGCCIILPKDVIELLYSIVLGKHQYSVKKLHEFIIHLLIPFSYKSVLKLRSST